MNTKYGIYRFPNEMVSNEKKKSFEFGREYGSAIWSQWEAKFYSRNAKHTKWRKYANGEQDIARIEKNIMRNYIKKEFLHYDKEDRIKDLAWLLREFKNSVDMGEFIPVVKATDPFAMEIKDTRKNEKMKLFYAKDFLMQAAQLNGGQSPIPLESIPQSKEQVDLEEETAKPLRVERGELKALDFFSLTNRFDLIQEEVMDDALDSNIMISYTSTDPIEGIKIKRIHPDKYVGDEDNPDKYFTNSRYHGHIDHITVGTFRNIASASGLKFTEEQIVKIAGCSTIDELNDNILIKVLFYSYQTYFLDVKKKKINRNTKSISLIDRSKDIGTDKEYSPKLASDKSEKIEENYDVWFEGIMVLDADRTLIRHRLVQNIPSYKGKILSPYVVCRPRKIGIVEELIPRIDAMTELRLRILHLRNTLRGDTLNVFQDEITDVHLNGKDQPPLPPQEVLSFLLTLGINFIKTRDDEGDPIPGGKTSFSVTPESIPRSLIELSNQYLQEEQKLYRAFGAYQYNQVKQDPKTNTINEPYRMTDNTAMRDYTNCLFEWSRQNLQVISARLNDAIEFPYVKQMLEDNLGDEDVNVMTQYFKDRKQHYFGLYLDYIPSQQERLDFAAGIKVHLQNGELTVADEWDLMMIRNPNQARATLALRLEANRKRMEQFEINKVKEASNANIEASNAAYENKAKLSQQEHEQKLQLEQYKFNNETFLLQKDGEIKINVANVSANAKVTGDQFRQQFEADLTKFKKEQDAKNRQEAINLSYDKQEKLFKLKQGEIDSINDESPAQPIDLSTLQNTI